MAGTDGCSQLQAPAKRQVEYMKSQPETMGRSSRFGSRKIDESYEADGAWKQPRGP